MTKIEVKKCYRGMMQHWGGRHPRSEFSRNVITDAKKVKYLGERLKKVVRNFATGTQNIFEGIQEPIWPRESNSLCTPLVIRPIMYAIYSQTNLQRRVEGIQRETQKGPRPRLFRVTHVP